MNSSPTSIFEFPQNSPFNNIVLKREDKSPYGSHKARYLSGLLSKLVAEGHKQAVLSTTGNAGITASLIGKELGISIMCLMSEKGSASKSVQIEEAGGFLIQTARPVRFSKYVAKKYQIPLIRMSADEEASQSYQNLGQEIIEQVTDADAMVNFATSGTSSLGIMQAYEDAGRKLPALHLVQSGKSCSIVQELHPEQIDQLEYERSVGLKETPHRDVLLEWINKSEGDAHYISQEYRKKRGITEMLADYDIQTSWEGECSFAAAQKISSQYSKVVVILSGKQWPNVELKNPQRAESFEEIDQYWEKYLTKNQVV
jgi:threonine dehydratase